MRVGHREKGRSCMADGSPTPQTPRAFHLARILEVLRRDRRTTRPRIAELTGLSRTAVGALTDVFLRRGLANSAGQEEPSIGRPATILEFDPDAALALGADLVKNTWQIVAINLDGQVVEGIEAGIADYAPDAAVQSLQRGVLDLVSRVGSERVLPAIGVSTPGLVDVRSGIVRSARDYGWTDVPIRSIVERHLGLETLVANRGKVGALAELWHTRDNNKDLIFIFIGSEIAAGIAHNGKLYLGSNSNAGDLGHMTVLPDGPICHCGNRGCLAELVSTPAIEKLIRTRLRENGSGLVGHAAEGWVEPLTVESVFCAAEEGDPVARQVVDEVAGYLGIAIANVVNLFNPELVILGGPVGLSGPVLVEPLRREVNRRATPYALGVVTIASSELGAQAGSVGAAVLVLQQAARLLFTRG